MGATLGIQGFGVLGCRVAAAWGVTAFTPVAFETSPSWGSCFAVSELSMLGQRAGFPRFLDA